MPLLSVRIESERLRPDECGRGWNKVVHRAAQTVEELRDYQQRLRSEERYEEADHVREMWVSLEGALNFMRQKWERV
jgi:hypothetical protein